ncbi:splicing factor 3B subunit 1 [Gregarina niphandrodes]|uniref:Splicing factor 3B subunit 1 n=1 Tax=Gregarina niphandrodes TaxID=110365 RepID=A0A023B0A0_GRENI|nr:splicing factor 3B subunit 1 [Gregarina niphandrodes]EZG45103.1 splicing factor 3B subunit 1 [Gregarina niphandrodes]|eukprot:XP_011132566.1 splicing factor 3B subunit 1 [Gregarina niphandrodes]
MFSQWDTPIVGGPVDTKKRQREDDAQTPLPGTILDTPLPASNDVPAKKTRWEEARWDDASSTPVAVPGMTSLGTPGTPEVPSAAGGLTAVQRAVLQDPRNRPLTDEELDALLPTEGYEVVQPPAGYVQTKHVPAALAAGLGLDEGVRQTPAEFESFTTLPAAPEVAMEDLSMKAEDYEFFRKLFEDVDESALSVEELRERRISLLLLKIKNGTPPLRRAALKQITARAREFGPEPLFNQILPLMMQSAADDQERHLLVKVIDRVLYKLDDQVQPYVHKILVVIEPLLIDEDYYARVEGREIISNLSKAAGLGTMIATMRPDIDHPDEYVRNTTARAFAVVASALGISSLILFLKAVCQSKKSWQARHTGIKIVQQTAILMGCAVLPHLRQLVEIIATGLQDEHAKVRTITALALSALAEAAHPYGIETFDCVLRPLWQGICEYRGKGLAAFLKAMGLIIPLMDPEHADVYTRETMRIVCREFNTPDDEMKKVILKVIKLCAATQGVEADYIRAEVLPDFFQNFLVVRNALDRANRRQVVETTVELANKCGSAEILKRLVDPLKNSSEVFRHMALEIADQVVLNLGVDEIDQELEELFIDGLLFCFQEQSSEADSEVVLNAFGSIANTLGMRLKPYLKHITGVIRWRLNTPSARVRQQAADLISRIAAVMKKCGEEQMLSHFGLFLYEYLGEEYPEVLGSILCALKSIINVIGIRIMTPPIKDLLPRLTPILRNRHEKVQENVIDLIGRIADRGGDMVSPKEWDRICFDLLELLKAHKKSIRRTTINTFGYIARTIGPHDVMVTLMNNLRVQERQLRICTTIAIAIVAETCLPYTVLPALMNEYKIPDVNVQHGVLKALSFLFEYIGEMGRDYIYAVVPLLQDALMDRDIVHRQTAAWVCKHLALGVHGLSREDALIHCLNYVWPNIFETPAHLTQATFDAISGFRVALGPGIMLNYLLQGLFHPARKTREIYWRIYNSVYIGHNDALVSFYPELEPDENNDYRRPELEMCL